MCLSKNVCERQYTFKLEMKYFIKCSYFKSCEYIPKLMPEMFKVNALVNIIYEFLNNSHCFQNYYFNCQ